MNYLMSPPLVVAYALAGSMDIDITTEPLGQDPDGVDVFLKDDDASVGYGLLLLQSSQQLVGGWTTGAAF